MYYGDTLLDNDHENFELKRASKMAATAWRFRHLEHKGVKLLKALAARMLRLIAAPRRPRDTAARPTREQLSY